MREGKAMKPGGPSGAVYFFGLIGALVWYLQQAHTFWSTILAILKAFVCPALLVYDVLKFVH